MSQLQVHTVSVFEAFLPTPIVLTNAEVWGLQSTFHFGFGSTGFCSLLLRPCLLKLQCFPCFLPYLLNSSMGCLPARAEGSGRQLPVSFSTCIVSCSCFPGHLHCRWRPLCTGACLWLWTGRFIPQHGGTTVGQYKPGNLSILFSINLGNAKSTSTLLSQLLGWSQMLSSLVSPEHNHLSWCRFLPAEPWSHCVTSAVPLLVTGLSPFHFTPEFYF